MYPFDSAACKIFSKDGKFISSDYIPPFPDGKTEEAYKWADTVAAEMFETAHRACSSPPPVWKSLPDNMQLVAGFADVSKDEFTKTFSENLRQLIDFSILAGVDFYEFVHFCGKQFQLYTLKSGIFFCITGHGPS